MKLAKRWQYPLMLWTVILGIPMFVALVVEVLRLCDRLGISEAWLGLLFVAAIMAKVTRDMYRAGKNVDELSKETV